MNQTLKDYLEVNCLYAQYAVSLVEPGEDLEPIFSAFGADGQTRILDPRSIRLGSADEKHDTQLAFRSLLREIHAKRYAIIIACWIEIGHTEDSFVLDRLIEGYEIVVGDQSGSLLASFETIRDSECSIVKLRRLLPDPQLCSGRFVDLLVGREANTED